MSAYYGVMGNPIKHSLSPDIHALFAQQTKQDMHYQALLVGEQEFTAAVHRFFAQGGKGLNVTLPFKQQAWQLAQQTSQRADNAQAVNTLTLLDDGQIHGDNTDGEGLLNDLSNQYAQQLDGKRLLIIGAGGAVRGVLANLLAENPCEVVISNRTLASAELLAEHFADQGQINALPMAQVKGPFDVIINGTSASLQQRLPELHEQLVNSHTLVYDMVYGAKPTVFMQWGLEQGAHQVADGLGMLVEQAAAAFKIWRQVEPNSIQAISHIRKQLSNN